mmetsp:Transcript_21960/g.33529  ORF Transcript_21960/g.33529 Transcript_21960/m.33529 type:complete len:96 (-) Transcript_21960:151-438(-)
MHGVEDGFEIYMLATYVLGTRRYLIAVYHRMHVFFCLLRYHLTTESQLHGNVRGLPACHHHAPAASTAPFEQLATELNARDRRAPILFFLIASTF